jgi:hypothetical protein
MRVEEEDGDDDAAGGDLFETTPFTNTDLGSTRLLLKQKR